MKGNSKPVVMTIVIGIILIIALFVTGVIQPGPLLGGGGPPSGMMRPGNGQGAPPQGGPPQGEFPGN